MDFHCIHWLAFVFALVLRHILLIVKPYSASEMFATHNIPSFDELLRKWKFGICCEML